MDRLKTVPQPPRQPGPFVAPPIENWWLTSLQQRLVTTGGRLIKHARYHWLMLAESHLTRRLLGSMVRRTEALPVATGQQGGDETANSGRPGRGVGEVFAE